MQSGTTFDDATMSIRLVWILAFILAGALTARAQLSPDIATDEELFAAHCLGMIQATRSAIISNLRGADVDAIFGPIVQGMNDEIARIQTYLVARGLTSPTRSVAAKQGVTLSIERGRTDSSICGAQIDRCVAQCSKTRPYQQKCVDDCRDQEPKCRAAARCGDDRLPF